MTADRRFPFVFDPPLFPFGLPFGVTPSTALVLVTSDDLHVRFGLWSLHTGLDNVAGAERTGPYRPWRVAGPARLSLTDRGLTFATNTRAGVCICFHRPVRPVPPFPLLRHPALTVTVADPNGLVELLASVVDRPMERPMSSSGA
ncbi:MAG: hypothetical protein ACRD0A_17880 [Acidimicrobiales bacterium]